MKKYLVIFLYIIALIVLVIVFLTSKTYTQLTIASLIYTPLAYLAFVNIPKNKKSPDNFQSPSSSVSPIQPIPPTFAYEETEADDSSFSRGGIDIVDIDKRAFLKLIGAAGLSFFIFSIFTRKAESLLFDRALTPGITSLENRLGSKINPAEKYPTDGYQISEIDEGESTYCGFTNQAGSWFIMKELAQSGSFRYIKGGSNFPENWANRTRLNYDYFHNVFQG